MTRHFTLSSAMQTARTVCIMAVLLPLLTALSNSASAMNIQKVISKKGIEAWLVEDHSRQIISVQFAFFGGSAQDPDDKPGVATFITGMMDEGAGDLNSMAFQKRLEDLAVRISFNATPDHIAGSLQTLTPNKDEAVRLLNLALTKPNFTPEDAARIREQLVANVRLEDKDPDKVASREWSKLAFGNHPYARPPGGTLESLAAITPDDLHAFRKRNFARDNLKVAVVGDVDPATLSSMLDAIFGDLPAKADLKPIPEVNWSPGVRQKVVRMPNPQSVAQFGFEGLKRKDRDFIPAFVLNYVVGGGGFASKLTQEVREKRGLAYSVYTYLYPLDRVGVFAGGVATENKEVGRSLDVIRSELDRVAKEGVTEQELRAAKDYLIGSFALRFDTSVKIASQLLAIQLEDLGIDYIKRRNSEIEAVTVADIKRIAQRLLTTKNLIVTVVGEPEGINEVGL